MILKALIFLITLTAHIWLWGQWSLERSSGFTVLLALNTALVVFLIVYSSKFLMETKSIKALFEKKLFSYSGIGYVIVTSILCFMSFYGIIRYILPINVLLLGAKFFFQWKNKKGTKSEESS